MRTMMSLVGTMLCLASAMGYAQTRATVQVANAAVKTPAAQSQPLNHEGEGRRLFLSLNCYSCHGMYAAGGMGPSIVHAEKGDLNEALMQGEEGGMPSFRNYVKSRDIKNLTAYLQSIGTSKEPKFMDWWEDIPPK